MSYQSKYTGQEIDSKLDLVDNKVNQSDLLNKIYPIGSIYQSVASTSPASFLGGTWEVLSGQFLIGANSTYSAGSTGGTTSHTHTSAAHTHSINGHTHTSAAHTHTTAEHTLTLTEMPNHYHNVAISKYDGTNMTYWGECRAYGSGGAWGYGYIESGNPPGNQVCATYTGGGGSHSHGNTGSTTPSATGSTSLTTNSTTPGNTGSSSNMPPYLSVYMWKRIA